MKSSKNNFPYCLNIAHILIIVNMCFTTIAFAQTVQEIEVLDQVNESLAKKDFNKAISVLELHKGNESIDRLLAQSYYWSGNVQKAKILYKELLNDNPENNILLDYGRMLYELHEEDQAETILNEFLNKDPLNLEANLYLGYLRFLKEDYNSSINHFRIILDQIPDHDESLQMIRSIKDLRAIYLEIGSSFQSDNQPLDRSNQFVKASKYLNQFLNLDLAIHSYSFDLESDNQHAQRFDIGNTFSFSKFGLRMHCSAGVYLNHIDGDKEWVGNASINKSLFKGLSFIGEWKHQPVFNAISSLSEVVKSDNFSFLFNYANGDDWMGSSALEYNIFNDDNSIRHAYLWFLSPVLKMNKSKFRIGYSGSFSDSKELRFTSEQNLDEIISEFEEGNEITGIYSPYFTPINQSIHSIIANYKVTITNNIELSISSNIGISTSADIPYLYLDNNEMGIDLTKEFFKEKTTNIDLNATLDIKLSKNLNLNALYQYSDNFFYEANFFQLKLNWMIHDGK